MTEATDDPLIWLEEVEGRDALAWVDAQNASTLGRLRGDAFERDRLAALALLTADDRIPAVELRGDRLYNFWTDREHPRGLWRRTTRDSYRTDAPDWEVLLDLDALGAAEGESWVWRGCDTLPPSHTRGLVALSRGGADACVIREFDLEGKRFVADGFTLPEGKSAATWLDRDRVYAGTAKGDDSTASGYPRVMRLWRRGQPFDEAPPAFEGLASDLSVTAYRDRRASHTLFSRQIDFWNRERFIHPDRGTARRLDLPLDASTDVEGTLLTVWLRTGWLGHSAGALLLIDLDAFLAGDRAFTEVFTPAPRRSLTRWLVLQDRVVLAILDDLRGSVAVAARDDGWKVVPCEGLPEGATLHCGRLSPYNESDEVVIWATGYLTPLTMFFADRGARPVPVKLGQPRFDAAGLTVARHEAVAEDGTRVPYFQVGPAGAADAFVRMTGYGGFGVSTLPGYQPVLGKLWLERGHVFVSTVLRGGGEFGPDWHRAGQREGKRVAQDDFAAVAADLVRRGVTSPAKLAAEGGSNGGLLVGNMLTRHPDLFGALLCRIPLLDMRRYAKLLAGASWIAELGDPDRPDDWAFLRTLSPYHLLEAGRAYPPVLFTTTRRDDRVHPGHARKMAARMQALGSDALLFEQAEGGHGSGADAEQRAFGLALDLAFLRLGLRMPVRAGPEGAASRAGS